MILLELLLTVGLVGGWQTSGPANGGYTGDVAVAAGSGHRVFAAAFEGALGNGVYRSDDGGESWQRISGTPGPDYVTTLAPDPHDPDRVLAATVHAGFSGFTTSLFRSVDAGETWTQVHGQYLASSCEIAFDPVAPGVVYVSYAELQSRAVYRSDDGGGTFTGLAAPFSGAHLAVAADGTVVAASDAVYVSHDRAQSWMRAADPGLPCPITALAVDPVDPDRWYLGAGQTLFPCGGAVRTNDGGSTWIPLADPGGSINDLATAASQPGVIYASTGSPEPSVAPGHVVSSIDGGATWFDNGGPPTDGINAIALPDDGGRIYAATGAGVYRKPLRRTTTLPPRSAPP